jgi:hypothetical protein
MEEEGPEMTSRASELKTLAARLVLILNHLRQLDVRIHVGLGPDATPILSDFKMGMRRCGALLVIILLLSGSAVYADTALASHKCTAPMKQREFATQAQLERYKSAVELYRSCLEAFVKEQETAIETHRQAAQTAIGDWNRFVGQETKEPPRAPEDKRDNQEFRGIP